MKMWIGGQENLQPDDVITNWSPSEAGITLQVQRVDKDTVNAVLNRLYKVLPNSISYTDALDKVNIEFGVVK